MPKILGVSQADSGHAVVTVETAGPNRNRRDVCAECPWRKDSPTGAFPAEAYRISATTAHDGAFEMFACHMAGRERACTCAGFLAAQGAHNVGVRIMQISGSFNPADLAISVPTYTTYREMAIANGVAPDDPCLSGLRDDGQL